MVQVTPKDSKAGAEVAAGPSAPLPFSPLNAPTLLAVSGGADSMAMLALALDRCAGHVAAVATFDHGTGAHAREAVSLVRAWARERGVRVMVGRAAPSDAAGAGTEATWRALRWAFLRATAQRLGVDAIATAHTADDQVETVFMRLLRGSGVRGLAGLHGSRADVVRPLLGARRDDVRTWASAAGIPWLDDPANADARHLRVRVRSELLPAAERAEPGFREWLLDIGERAAGVRQGIAGASGDVFTIDATKAEVAVPRRLASRLPADGLAMLWSDAAARVGVVLDRRGTDRLVSVTIRGRPAGPIPLSGGAAMRAVGDVWVLSAPVRPNP
jgi:tRNA(Ile)-lysidine synthase